MVSTPDRGWNTCLHSQESGNWKRGWLGLRPLRPAALERSSPSPSLVPLRSVEPPESLPWGTALPWRSGTNPHRPHRQRLAPRPTEPSSRNTRGGRIVRRPLKAIAADLLILTGDSGRGLPASEELCAFLSLLPPRRAAAYQTA